MSLAILVVGGLMFAGSAVIMVAPGMIKEISRVFLKRPWVQVAATFRIAIGVLFILAARDTRFPTYIMICGVIIVLAGLALAFMGTARTKAFVEWWLARSNLVMRLVALAGLAFAASCVWAAL